MPDDATMTADDPAQDTSAASSAPADTSQPAAPEPQDAQTTDAPGTDATAAPSTTTQQVQNQTQPGEPEVDWKDRYSNLQSYSDRRHQQYQQHLTKMQSELQEFRKQKEMVPPKLWDKSHPEHQQFRGLLERSKAIHRQVQAADKLPPEQKQQALEAIMAGVTPEEQQNLSQFRESMQAFQTEFFSDPETTLAPLIQRGVQQAMQQVQQQMQGQQQVDRDFSAPHLQPILKDPKYAGYLNEKLQKGVPYEEAMELMKLRAATDMMYRKLNGSERQMQHAQEQTRLVRGRAQQTVQTDPASAPADPYKLAVKEAAKRGVQPGTAAFNRILDSFTNQA